VSNSVYLVYGILGCCLGWSSSNTRQFTNRRCKTFTVASGRPSACWCCWTWTLDFKRCLLISFFFLQRR